MKQLKKTILTLVALLAVTAGAWAQTETLLTTITFGGTSTYSETTSGVVSVTATGVGHYDATYGWLWFGEGSLSVTAEEGYTITKCVFIQNAKQPITDTEAPFVIHSHAKGYFTENAEMDGVTSIEVYGPAPSAGPKVAWDNAKKTGTFTMPGGNVELEPEYYPQAELATDPTAINDVPATTDGAIVSAGTVATIDGTTTAQGTVMYYAMQSATAPTAPDYDATGWTDKVPTATDFAEGNVYVWYYVKGADGDETSTFNDGAITKLGDSGYITLLAAPTYAVTFAEGTDPNEWTASPNTGVTKGQTVTVTYSGAKKVLGVKAEKKAAGPVTYTELKGGEVLKPGDILNFSDANVRYIFNDFNLFASYCPFTVLRANITGDPIDPTVTPADDGAYYVIQTNGGFNLFSLDLSVTATSDGILITINSEDGNNRYCTVSVHEP